MLGATDLISAAGMPPMTCRKRKQCPVTAAGEQAQAPWEGQSTHTDAAAKAVPSSPPATSARRKDQAGTAAGGPSVAPPDARCHVSSHSSQRPHLDTSGQLREVEGAGAEVRGTDELHLGGNEDEASLLGSAVPSTSEGGPRPYPTLPPVSISSKRQLPEVGTEQHVPRQVRPRVGGALPPPGDECQLPGDLVEGYGIKDTRVLTTSEAHAQ
jgi:hypothetical protein